MAAWWQTVHGSSVATTIEQSAVDAFQPQEDVGCHSTVLNAFTGQAASDPRSADPDAHILALGCLLKQALLARHRLALKTSGRLALG